VRGARAERAGAPQAEGFSEAIIDRFFRPFLGGIFFDADLGTSSRLFEFVMRCLATGANCLPAAGIGAVAEQLAARLPAGAVRLGARAAGARPPWGRRPAPGPVLGPCPAPRACSRALPAAGQRSDRARAGACSMPHLHRCRAYSGVGRHAGRPPGGSAPADRRLCIGVLPGAAPGGGRVCPACVRVWPARGRGARS